MKKHYTIKKTKLIFGFIILLAQATLLKATTCPNAVLIPSSTTFPSAPISLVCGTTNDITSTNATACGSSSYMGGNEALFVYTPNANISNFTVAYSGVTWTGITIFQGCPTSGGICLGNVTSSATTKTTTPISLTAGVTYYIMIDTYPTPNSPCAGTIVLNGTVLQACSGTPTANTASISAVAGCVPSVLTLSSSNVNSASGILYQWQSSSSSSGPWSNIVGATATTSTISATLGTTYYQIVTTCTASGLSVNSNVVLYTGTACTSSNVPVTGSNTVTCGNSTVLYDNGGATSDYANNSNGYTVLQNSGSGVINLSGSFSYIETSYDYLKIYSGAGTGGTLLYTYSNSSGGIITPFSSSPGQILTVLFTSDGSGVGGGFNLNVVYTGTCASTALCSGTPVASTASISTVSGCAPLSINLSSSTNFNTGITYQWQSSSSSSGPWLNISGATVTNTTVSAGVGTTYYQMVTTCTVSGLSATSNTLSFNGISCSSLNVPASNSNTVTCGNSTVLYDNGGATGNYANSSNGFTVLQNSGSGVINLSGSYSGIESCCDYLKIYNGIGTAGTLLATYAGTGTITPFVSSPGQIITVLFYSDGSVNGAGFNLNVVYTGTCASTALCSGTPVASTASISTVSGCAPLSINLSSSTNFNTGITYQWQSSSSSSGPWLNISGATVTNTTVSAGVGTTYYQMVTTCTVSGLSATSNTLSFNGISCSSLNVPASNSNTVTCGNSTVLYDNGGATGNYANSSNGFTVLQNSGSGVINLSGSFSYIETSYDYLKIYSGAGTGGTLLYTYSNSSGGIITPFSSSPGQVLTVLFTSDGSGVGGGFNLNVVYTGTCALPCSGTVQHPANTVNISGSSLAVTNVISCSNAGEYSVDSFTATGVYTITSTGGSGNYITVKDATGSTVITSGNSPVSVNIATVGIYQIHITTSAPSTCGTDAVCHDVNVMAPFVLTNDACSDAITLSIPSTSIGSTIGATIENPTPPTCTTSLSQPGVWYKVSGNGNLIGASLCGSNGWDSKLFVYTGTCGNLTCLVSKDDNGPLCSGNEASVTWCSVVGVDYYVLVTGYSTANAFNISISQTVVAQPIINVSASSVCVGTSVALSATGVTSFTWSPGGSTSSSLLVNPIATTVYTLTGADASGCVNSSTQSIVVNPLPLVSVNNGTICSGNTFTMIPNGASTYVYSSGSNVVNPTLSNSYTVTGTDANGCIGTAISLVTVNASPMISVNSGSVCSGDNFTVTPSGASTYSYSTGSNIIRPSVTMTFTVTGTDVNGCDNLIGTIGSVTVNPLPLVSSIASPTILCNDGSTGPSILTASTSAVTYTWSNGANTMTTSVTPTLTTTYTLAVTNIEGCSDEAYITIIVNDCSGLKEIQNNDVLVYPNPTKDILTILMTSRFKQTARIELYDSMGKLVIKENLLNESNVINVSNIENGMYFYKIIYDDVDISIGKVIKH